MTWKNKEKYAKPRPSGDCPLCGTFRSRLQKDHITPKFKGGLDTPENIQYICANCHQDKSAIENKEKARMSWANPESRKRLVEGISAGLKRSYSRNPAKRAAVKSSNQKRAIDPEFRQKYPKEYRIKNHFSLDSLPFPEDK